MDAQTSPFFFFLCGSACFRVRESVQERGGGGVGGGAVARMLQSGLAPEARVSRLPRAQRAPETLRSAGRGATHARFRNLEEKKDLGWQ